MTGNIERIELKGAVMALKGSQQTQTMGGTPQRTARPARTSAPDVRFPGTPSTPPPMPAHHFADMGGPRLRRTLKADPGESLNAFVGRIVHAYVDDVEEANMGRWPRGETIAARKSRLNLDAWELGAAKALQAFARDTRYGPLPVADALDKVRRDPAQLARHADAVRIVLDGRLP
jgi:hypothetical protein